MRSNLEKGVLYRKQPGPLLHRHPEKLGVVRTEVQPAKPVDRLCRKGLAVRLERAVLQPLPDPGHVPRQRPRELVGRWDEPLRAGRRLPNSNQRFGLGKDNRGAAVPWSAGKVRQTRPPGGMISG